MVRSSAVSVGSSPSLPPMAPQVASASIAAGRSSPIPLLHLNAAAPTGVSFQSSLHSRRGFSVPPPALLGQDCFVSDLLAGARMMGSDTRAMERYVHEAAERRAQRLRRRQEGATLPEDDEEDPDEDQANTNAGLIPTTGPLADTFYHTLVSLVLHMRESSHGILDPSRLKNLIASRYKKFAGSDQQDAHEFLSECLTHLDEDIQQVLTPPLQRASGDGDGDVDMLPVDGKRAPSPAPYAHASTLTTPSPPMPSPPSATLQLQVDTISPIYRSLHFEFESRLTCVKCNCSRYRSEHFNDLSLDLPDAPSKARAGSPAVSSNGGNSAASASTSPPPQPPSPQSASGGESPTSAADQSTSPPTLDAAADPAPINLPPPVCPRHHKTMKLQSSGASSSLTARYKCTASRCKEEKMVTHSIATLDETVALSTIPTNATAPTPNDAATNASAKPSSNTIPASATAATAAASSTSVSPASSSPLLGVKKGHGGAYLASLSQLVSKFFSPQLVTFSCTTPGCDSKTMTKRYTFKQLPKVLILHVKRFQPNWARGTYEKRADRLQVDETIDLSFACTGQTRKPIPLTPYDDADADMDTSDERHDADVNTNDGRRSQRRTQDDKPPLTTASGRQVRKPSATPPPPPPTPPAHEFDDHRNTLAPLFASSCRAACKCDTAGSCTHSHGVLTAPRDIAAFIARQHRPPTPVALSSTPMAAAMDSHSASSTNHLLPTKRKSMELAALLDNDARADKAAKKARLKQASSEPVNSTPAIDDRDSYFDSPGTSESAELNTLQTELRTLQQQLLEMHQLHCSLSPATFSSSSSSPLMGGGGGGSSATLTGATSARNLKRDSALAALLMRLAEVEDQIQVKREEQEEMMSRRQRNNNPSRKSKKPVSSSSHSRNNNSSSPSSSSSVDPDSLGVGVVPSYELSAIIHHKGQIATSGHYITDLKSMPLNADANSPFAPSASSLSTLTWKRYDDSYVRQLDATQALQYGEREGYIFLYQYQPAINIAHMRREQQEKHIQQQHQQAQANAAAAAAAAVQTNLSMADIPPIPLPPTSTSAQIPVPSSSSSPLSSSSSPSSVSPSSSSSSVGSHAPIAAPTRVKKWRMVDGKRVVWWVEREGQENSNGAKAERTE